MMNYRFLTHVEDDVREALNICDRKKLFYRIIGTVGSEAFDEAVKKAPNKDFSGALAILARKNKEAEAMLLPLVAVNNFVKGMVANEH